MFDQIKSVIRAFIIRALAEAVAGEIVQQGLTSEDEDVIRDAIGFPDP